MDVSPKRHATPATTYDVVTAVWGSEFIRLFLDVCVPNQLSPQNLAALPAGSRYRIFTGRADRAALASSPRLDQVRRILPVDVVEVDLTELDPQANPNTYKMMTACHRRAVADAASVDAALIFLAPDFILGEGTIAGLVRLHAGGARAVLTANLRLSSESFLAAWKARAGDAPVSSRELVGLGLRHLHPATASCFVEGPTSNDFPTSVYWPVRSGDRIEGLFVRALHLHPMLLDPVHREELPETTIDGHYLAQACPDLEQCVVVQDSDDLVVFELTPFERRVGNHDRRQGVSMPRLAAVAAKCDAYQRSHWHRPIRLHVADVDERWSAAAAHSAAFVAELERYRWFGPLLSRVFRAMKVWRRRRAGYARSVRRTIRTEARGAIRVARRSTRRGRASVRSFRKAVQPQRTLKRLSRSARVLYHRAAKAGRMTLKRARRSVRLFRPA